jgi:hypothetical protein
MINPDVIEQEVAQLLAKSRIPSSTVYMDGSHNPKPSELQKAKQFRECFIDPLVTRTAELESKLLACHAEAEMRETINAKHRSEIEALKTELEVSRVGMLNVGIVYERQNSRIAELENELTDLHEMMSSIEEGQ